MQDKAYAYAQAIEEYTQEGSGPKRLSVTTTFADDLVSQTRYDELGTPTTRYVQADGFGSTRLLTDETGAVTDAIDYDAFGNVIARSGSTDIDHLYRGEALDPNTGFYYLRARYYDPSNGRFLSQDSFAGFSMDPQSLHKYAYTHNNPVNGIDPSGHMTLMQVGQGLAVMGTLAGIAQGSYQLYQGDYSGAAWTFVEVGALNGVAFWGKAGFKASASFLRWWSANRKVRVIYHGAVEEMMIAEKALRAANTPARQIAEQLVKLRNAAKVKTRALMNPKDVAKLEARNMKDYGDPVGPGVDFLIAKVLRKNPGMSEAQALEMVITGAYDTSRWYNLFFFVF